MNKYQEALTNISLIDLDPLSNGYDEPKLLADFNSHDVKILQELVNRATPAMPLRGLTLSAGWNIKTICHCGNILDRENHFCSNCGQAIEWGEEDE